MVSPRDNLYYHALTLSSALHISVLCTGFDGESSYYPHSSYAHCYPASRAAAAHHHLSTGASPATAAAAAAAAAAGYVDAVMDVATDMSMAGVYYSAQYSDPRQSAAAAAAAAGSIGAWSVLTHTHTPV